jgi:hypothetical protein
MEEVEQLILGLTGRPAERNDFDRDKFAEALGKTEEEGKRLWALYCDRGVVQDHVLKYS